MLARQLIRGGPSENHALEIVVQIEGCLRASEKKKTAGPEEFSNLSQDFLFYVRIEVNENIPQKNDVHLRHERPIRDKIELLEDDFFAQLL